MVRPWSRASAHHGSDHRPPHFAGSSGAQFGGSGANPLAPAVLEVGADHPCDLTWRTSTSEALPAPRGLACGLRAPSAVPCAMGGRARGIFGAHTKAGAHGEVGDGLCGGRARDGVAGGDGRGAEPLGLTSRRREKVSKVFAWPKKPLRQEGLSLQITTVI